MQHPLYFYAYIERPFDKVRMAFAEEMLDVLRHATDQAVERAVDLHASLSAELPGFQLSVPVEITAHSFDQTVTEGMKVCRLRLTWKADKVPSFFPRMEADLEAAYVNERETQLVLNGLYRPPLGSVGDMADSLLLHKLAEASVHRFLEEVVHKLEVMIPADVK